jgi:ubiquitin carboxyl-terminal hydrolase 5/13
MSQTPTSAALETIRRGLNQVKIPDQGSSVYKDECVYSFDTPESQGGLFVNLSTFHAVGYDYLDLDHQKTSQSLYLRQKWTKVLEEPTNKMEDVEAPTKMAIGGEGGFQVEQEKFHYEKEHEIYVMPDRISLSLPNDDLPIGVRLSVDAILAMEDATKRVAIEQCKL